MGKKCVQAAETTRTNMSTSATIPHSVIQIISSLCTKGIQPTTMQVFIHSLKTAFNHLKYLGLYTESTGPTITTIFFINKKPIITV